MRRIFYCLVFAFALTACHQSDVLEKLENIKAIGDTDPEKALLMADSLKLFMDEESEYVQMKYHLLSVRLNDKAYNLATNDLLIRKLVPYFEKNGTDVEKQEAYYYAGSVYRDLNDTPRALEYFLKSTEFHENIDSIVLRNSYSQLYNLYFTIGDCSNTLLYAKKEFEISQSSGLLNANTLSHVAYGYISTDSVAKASKYLDEALRLIQSNMSARKNVEILYSLLCAYSILNNKEKADICFELSKQNNTSKLGIYDTLAVAEYHKLNNKVDLAITCYQDILTSTQSIHDKCDASKNLFSLYSKSGDAAKAIEYGKEYVNVSESLYRGKQQELATTIHNRYQYHRDKEREQRLQDEVRQYRTKMYWAAFTCVFFLLLFWMQYNRKRSQHLKQLLKEAEKLQNAKDENNSLEQELEQANEALNNNKEKLKQAQEELAQTDQDLKAVTLQLREKLQQNAILKEFYQQNKLSINAKEVLKNIRKAAIGQHKLTPEEWDEFYVAVDELYPTFQDELLNSFGTYNAKQMRVFYLLRIGLTCPEIQNLADASRSTVYRWAEDYSKVIKENITTGNEQPEANTDI